MKLKVLVFSFFILAFIVTACSSAAQAPAPMTEADMAEGFGGSAMEYESPASEPRADDSFGSATNGAAIDRLVIKNANLSIVVADPAASMEEILKMAEAMGGFVVSSELYKVTTDQGDEFPRARITIRIPAEGLNEALETIKSGAGEVLSENVTGEDVTQQYTDLQSRLRNLEQAETQLQQIMDEARRTEDVLQVYNELTRVGEQIEVIKGQIQYYEQAAALSAISVEIQAEDAVQPLSIGGWEPVGVARDAIQTLIDALKVIANAAIWLVLFLLPVVLILAIPVLLVIYLVRRSRRKKKEMVQDTTP